MRPLIFRQLTAYEMNSSIKDLHLLWVNKFSFFVRNVDQLELEAGADFCLS